MIECDQRRKAKEYALQHMERKPQVLVFLDLNVSLPSLGLPSWWPSNPTATRFFRCVFVQFEVQYRSDTLCLPSLHFESTTGDRLNTWHLEQSRLLSHGPVLSPCITSNQWNALLRVRLSHWLHLRVGLVVPVSEVIHSDSPCPCRSSLGSCFSFVSFSGLDWPQFI